METTQLLLSQLPLASQYVEAASAYWSASSHPENLSDIVEAGRESTKQLTFKEKGILLGATALNLFQQGPGNEVLLGVVAGSTLIATENIPLTAAAVGATTGALELSSGAGTAYSLERFRPSVDIMRNRYIDTEKIEKKLEEQEEKRANRLARIYGVAFLGLSAGATIFEDLREKGRTFKDNMRTASLASGMLAVNNAVITSVLFGGAKATEEIAGVDNATEAFANTVSNPLITGSLVGAVFAAVKIKQRRETAKKMEINNKQQTDESEVLPTKRKSLFRRVLSKRRMQKNFNEPRLELEQTGEGL